MGGNKSSGSNKKDSGSKKQRQESSSSSGSNNTKKSKRQKTSRELQQDAADSTTPSNLDQGSNFDTPPVMEQLPAQGYAGATGTSFNSWQPRYTPPAPPSNPVPPYQNNNSAMNEMNQYPPTTEPNYTYGPVPTTSAPSYPSQYSSGSGGPSAQPEWTEPKEDKEPPHNQQQ